MNNASSIGTDAPDSGKRESILDFGDTYPHSTAGMRTTVPDAQGFSCGRQYLPLGFEPVGLILPMTASSLLVELMRSQGNPSFEILGQ